MSNSSDKNDDFNKSVNGGETLSDPRFVFSDEDKQEMARLAARKRAIEGEFEILSNGSRAYFIDKGWESSIISEDPIVENAGSFLEFKNLFLDNNIKTIFIPEDSIVTLSRIRELSRKYAVNKTIYIERKGDT